jgi:hypothetical protein
VLDAFWKVVSGVGIKPQTSDRERRTVDGLGLTLRDADVEDHK